VLVAVVAGELFGPRPALAAGILAAISPLALAVGASLESETLFTALVLGATAAALAARRERRIRWAVAAGALAGLAALTRTNGLLVVVAIALLAVPAAAHGRRRAAPLLATLLVGLAVVAPWTARNAILLHVLAPVSTETGNTLAGTYNDASMHHGEQWLIPGRTGAYRAIYRRYGASAQGDAVLQHAVLRWVADHPAYPLRVAAANTARLVGLTGPAWAAFSLRTMSLGGAMGVAVWLGVLLASALAVAGMWAARGRGVPAAFWLLLALLFLPAALVNGELRLGAPAQALALVFAGLALSTFSQRTLPTVRGAHPHRRRKLMRKKIIATIAGLAVLGLAGGVAFASGSGTTPAAGSRLDDGKDLVGQAKISEQQAITAAQTAASGDLNEVDLEHYNGTLVYNVDVGSHDVKVDAATGDVVASAQDD
jgi:uncharacterized membrane protein YkoI